jgi:hypothetical protein
VEKGTGVINARESRRRQEGTRIAATLRTATEGPTAPNFGRNRSSRYWDWNPHSALAAVQEKPRVSPENDSRPLCQLSRGIAIDRLERMACRSATILFGRPNVPKAIELRQDHACRRLSLADDEWDCREVPDRQTFRRSGGRAQDRQAIQSWTETEHCLTECELTEGAPAAPARGARLATMLHDVFPEN